MCASQAEAEAEIDGWTASGLIRGETKSDWSLNPPGNAAHLLQQFVQHCGHQTMAWRIQARAISVKHTLLVKVINCGQIGGPIT